MTLLSAKTAGISGHNPTTQAESTTLTWYAFPGHVTARHPAKRDGCLTGCTRCVLIGTHVEKHGNPHQSAKAFRKRIYTEPRDHENYLESAMIRLRWAVTRPDGISVHTWRSSTAPSVSSAPMTQREVFRHSSTPAPCLRPNGKPPTACADLSYDGLFQR